MTDTSINVDKEGFLRDLNDWNRVIAEQLAGAEGIVLTRDHWDVIDAARRYYAKYHISPVTRVLVKVIKQDLGPEKGRSIYLMQLFTSKPAKLVSKIAGLPKPTNCD